MTHLTLCEIKLTTLQQKLSSVKHIIDDYHLVQFETYLIELDLHIGSKKVEAQDLVTELPSLFIAVQRLLIAMHYHLDIFAHYLVKNVGVDWSQNEELVQQFEDLTVVHLSGEMKQFWCENIGVDVSQSER